MSPRTSDAELARTLQIAHRSDLAWTSGSGWFQYPKGGNRWIAIPDEVALKLVSDDLRGLYNAWIVTITNPIEAKAMAILLSAGKAKSVTALLEGALVKDDAEFDAQPYLLNTPSGVADLLTGDLLPHDSAHLFTKITKVAYVRGAKHALWDKTLTAVPVDVLPWLQQRMGQGAVGTIAPQGLLIVFRGGGSNGKTTLLGGCSDALGDYSVLVPDKVLLGNVNDHSTEMTVLKGARFAMIEETAQARKLDVTRLKKIIETPTISARKMRQDSMTWNASHTMFLSSNFRPVIIESDHGTWRRLALVEFPFTFKESNFRDLTKAPEVLEAALAWLVEGAVAHNAGALDIPETVKTDTDHWREETDLIMGFIRSRVDLDPTSTVLATDMLDAFNGHIGANGHSLWADRTFVQQFGSHDLLNGNAVDHKRTRDLSSLSRPMSKVGDPVPSQPWVWTGVRLKDDSDAELHKTTVNWAVAVASANQGSWQGGAGYGTN